MNKTHLTIALSGISLALTSFAATADQSAGWYYDEDRDTIVLTVEGSRTGIASSQPGRPSQSPVQHAGSWYHDEDRDTIVFTVEGSRTGIASSQPGRPSQSPVQHAGSWYHDEELDTIVFTVEGSRTGLVSSRASAPLELTMAEEDISWYQDE